MVIESFPHFWLLCLRGILTCSTHTLICAFSEEPSQVSHSPISPSRGQRDPPTTSTSNCDEVNHKHVMAWSSGTEHNLCCPILCDNRRPPWAYWAARISYSEKSALVLSLLLPLFPHQPFSPLQTLTFNQTQIPLCLLTYQADTGCC